jgi:hypothetical protein
VAVGVSGFALTAAGVDGEVVVLPAARVGGKVDGENVGGRKVGVALKVELDVVLALRPLTLYWKISNLLTSSASAGIKRRSKHSSQRRTASHVLAT